MKRKYNTADEDLCLWKCHPEKLCVNCRYFKVYTPGRSEYIPSTKFEMFCTRGRWMLSDLNEKKHYIMCLLVARECESFKIHEK